jgi:hypothetical protein
MKPGLLQPFASDRVTETLLCSPPGTSLAQS